MRRRLFSTVIVKDLAPDVPVIARVNRAENVERIYAAGADFALSISQVSGQLLAWRLLGKESVAVDPELRVIKVSTRGLENHHPKQNDLREKTGCTIVAVERGEDLLVEFGADFKFRSGDAVYVCGSAEATQKFYQHFRRNKTGGFNHKEHKGYKGFRTITCHTPQPEEKLQPLGASSPTIPVNPFAFTAPFAVKYTIPNLLLCDLCALCG